MISQIKEALMVTHKQLTQEQRYQIYALMKMGYHQQIADGGVGKDLEMFSQLKQLIVIESSQL